MEFDAEVTLRDFIEFVKAAQVRNRPARLKRTLVVLLLATSLAALQIADLALSGGLMSGGWLLLYTLTTLLAGALLAVNGFAVAAPLPDGSTLGPKRVVVSDEGLTQSGEHGSGTTAWPGVTALFESKNVLIVFTDACAGYIVPRRAFTGPVQEQEFQERMSEASGLEWLRR